MLNFETNSHQPRKSYNLKLQLKSRYNDFISNTKFHIQQSKTNSLSSRKYISDNSSRDIWYLETQIHACNYPLLNTSLIKNKIKYCVHLIRHIQLNFKFYFFLKSQTNPQKLAPEWIDPETLKRPYSKVSN